MEKKTFKRILKPEEVAQRPAPPAPLPPPPQTLPDDQPFPWKQQNKVTLYADSDDGIPGHYKQWSVWIESGQGDEDLALVTEWGKRGSTLQKKIRAWYKSETTAINELLKLVNAKKKKGYRVNP